MTPWERRAARAESLAGDAESARAPLRLAAVLWRAQGVLAAALGTTPIVGRPEDDFGPRAAVAVGELLDRVAAEAPAPLATDARARAREDPRTYLVPWWRGSRSGREDYLARAIARPYAELLVARDLGPRGEPPWCRLCSGRPWVAYRGEGGARFVVCALCGGEASVPRIECPACGEADPEKLAVFQGDRHPAARIEACLACRGYLKSIDLSVDARALPEVDELASLALDLWAEENGYVRLEPGLAGI